MKILTTEEVLKHLQQSQKPYQESYKAMYSSYLGGITMDPSFMMIPMDDHLVHRGDGVFEAIKFMNHRYYLLEGHLFRLQNSAERIGIPLKHSTEELKVLVKEVVSASGLSTGMVRFFVSRGPGGYTTNPYESTGTQIYIVVTEFKPMDESKYQQGVKIGRSEVTVKPSWLAQAKTCNYLPNVMMKKEAVDRKIDFTIGVDINGFLTESSTENVIFIDSENNLIKPRAEFILRGLTMTTALELAEKNKHSLGIKAILEKDISEKELLSAKEVMMAGTTLDILPVQSYEGHRIGDGKFVLASKLRALLVRFCEA